MTVREAQVVWEGDLPSGSGRASAISSGTFHDLPVSWPSRTEVPQERTSPEELIAAAHASCFSMALAKELSDQEVRPIRLEVRAAVSFEQRGGAWGIRESRLEVRGRLRGIDEQGFQRAAEAAKEGCPVSQALQGNVEISVRAILEPPGREHRPPQAPAPRA